MAKSNNGFAHLDTTLDEHGQRRSKRPRRATSVSVTMPVLDEYHDTALVVHVGVLDDWEVTRRFKQTLEAYLPGAVAEAAGDIFEEWDTGKTMAQLRLKTPHDHYTVAVTGRAEVAKVRAAVFAAQQRFSDFASLTWVSLASNANYFIPELPAADSDEPHDLR